MGWDGLLLLNILHNNQLKELGHTSNPENSDTFINKAVLTVASYTRTIYYKYNRILIFYHLPFAFMESK